MPESKTVSTASPAVRIHRFRAMASQVTVQLVGIGINEAAEAFAKVEAIFDQVETACTRFNPSSPLMTANSSPRRWHELPDSCFQAIREAHTAHRVTEGLFDPRVLRSLEAHGYDKSLPFSTGTVHIDHEAPATVRPVRGRWRPRFDDKRGAVKVGPEPIDLGGIGKGLAVRWAMAAVRDYGSGALIEAGGDLATRGLGPEATEWRAAVEDPMVPAGEQQRQPVAVLAVSDRAVATSSIRLRTWRLAGREVHHLIDPRTGRPSAGGLASVTVIHADPASAEVWSKALFLLGAAEIAAEAQRRGLAAVWVDLAGRVRVSPAGRKHILWQVQHAGS